MTEQVKLWAGNFGDDYQHRSPGDVQSNMAMFARVLRAIGNPEPQSVIEFGAGMGANLEAIARLCPKNDLAALEVNAHATAALLGLHILKAMYQEPITTWHPPRQFELAFTKGLLIHIAPEDLQAAYRTIYHASSRWILLAEYYAPKHTEIEYRARRNMLWKGDFAGEMMEAFPDLVLVDYGFIYHRDPYPQDDVTWFLLKKEGA